MNNLIAEEASYGFGRAISLARVEPVAVTNHGRSVAVVMAVESSSG
jgi:hypothetical protein